MDKLYDLAVVGAAGPAGEAVLELLAERRLPLGAVHALDYGEAVGGEVHYGHRELDIGDAAAFDFATVAVALFVGDRARTAAHAAAAAAAGAIVIDGSGAYADDPDVPLVLPALNAEALAQYDVRGIVASPDSLATMLLAVLRPLAVSVGLEALEIFACVSVSAAGRAAVEELGQQTAALLNFREAEVQVLPKQIAFNLIPQVGAFSENGEGGTDCEDGVARQLRRLLADDGLHVGVSAIRVPMFYGQSAAVHLRTRTPCSAATARQLLADAGIKIIDRARDGGYPTPVSDASGSEEVYVGRLRNAAGDAKNLNLWVVSDNIRQGVAQNLIQITERLLSTHLQGP